MLRFNYGYKHLKLKIGNLEIIIELSYDNTLKKPIYSAKSNILFKDQYGDWGHAVGVGDNEEQALQMCYKELEDYLNIKFNKVDMANVSDFDLPKRITIQHKEDVVVLYVKAYQEQQVILTSFGKIIIDKNTNLLEYLNKNIKQFINRGVNNMPDEFFANNEFAPIFNKLSTKYNSNNFLSKSA